ncbi:MFS transporter [Curtobacterium sp. MCLR17_007]|uniref:MFS transporter n=1 Tax=Curtobacterium sp. MCLR17_007 TaxID=2175648 RepID=UPI000DA8576B|nr:MFS transporter [Curtobacterium sp. MCLR17_007]WIB61103.1 MFS transporter [Curtobacterium sp. MCLR17_007]
MKRAYLFIVLSAAGVASFGVVDIVYFQTVGYALAFVGLMTAAFNVAVSAAELPFAVLFDRYSNKLALQVGNALRVIAFLLFFLDLGPDSLLLAQVIAGFGVAASSGTSNALVMKQVQSSQPDRLSRAFGRITYFSAAASVAGGLVGSAVYVVAPRDIWLVAVVFCLTAGLIIFGFSDTKTSNVRTPWPAYARDVCAIARKRSTIALVLVNASAVAPFLLWQLKFDMVSLAFLVFGFLLMNTAKVASPLLMGRLSLRTAHIPRVTIANVVAAALFGVSDAPWAVAASFFLHVLLHTLLLVLVSGVFHASVTDDIRATAGSIVSLFDSLVVAIVAPVVAWTGQVLGFGAAVAISCVLYASVAAVTRHPPGVMSMEN